jgi:hypothetical protein
MIRSVILPATTPSIFAGMRVGLGLGLVLVVLAEMLAGETGIGFLILDLQRSFQIKEMFAWLFILVLLGGGLPYLFNKIEVYLLPWRGRASRLLFLNQTSRSPSWNTAARVTADRSKTLLKPWGFCRYRTTDPHHDGFGGADKRGRITDHS